jgi:flagellar biosynthetic protein FlhB
MSEQIGEKTEQPTPRHLEEALKKGRVARSREVQTVFVLMAGLLALKFTGAETWRLMGRSLISSFSHLHDTPLSVDAMQGYAVTGALLLGQCVWPVLAATMVGGLLAGGIQTRFRATSDALAVDWERISPLQGFKRLFSRSAAVSTGIGIVKLSVVIALCFNVTKQVLQDPIFHSAVDLARIAQFMADSAFRIILQAAVALIVLAAVDYGYQFWQTNQDLKMTRQELKDETKHTEGNPLVKAQQRRRRQAFTKRRMLAEVPKADVIVTNPTHISIALRYDKKTMKAPVIVAKGSRLNALRIREIARQYQVPIIENKPLARLMFKYGRVGGEIPAQFYAVVAEVLAWVYRVNAYRYYREQCQNL